MLTVVHPRCLERYRGRGGQWVYADEKLETFQEVERVLGARLRRFVPPAEFQSAVMRLRRPFVEWVDGNLQGKRPVEWLLTPLYKNPYSNNLFLHCVWLTLIVEGLKRGGAELVVITASSGLARALRDNCVRQGVPYGCVGRILFATGAWFAAIRSVLGLGLRALDHICRALAARAILGKPYVAALQQTDALIETFIHDGDLSVEGAFNDRYFPGVIQTYAKHGLKNAYYPLLYRIPLRKVPETYRRMRRCTLLFAPFELFIRATDVLHAAAICLLSGLRGARLPQPLFEGSDATFLAAGIALRAATAGLLPLLLARAPKRMAAAGVRPAWVLEWFENQPIDKANVIGFQSTGSTCSVIAARQYIPSPNLLSLYTTRGEVAAGVAPPVNWVCGRTLVQTLSVYDPHGQYRIVPALRYAHLHRAAAAEGSRTELLVVLTHSLEESLAILNCIASELPGVARLFARVAIKPHPDTDFSHVRAVAEARWTGLRDSRNLYWTQEPVSALLTRARIAVSAGSNAALESLCHGVPVILVGRNAGLDINPLESVMPQMWTLVYEPQQLRAVAEQWSPTHPLSPHALRSLGKEVRDALFEPVTEATMKAFLPPPPAEAAPAPGIR